METDGKGPILDTWDEIKTIMNELELHIVKNARGVAAAGVRARKGLREIKKKASHLVKLTVDMDKSKKASPKDEAPEPKDE